MENRKIVIVNQAVNYLTIGICNEFNNSLNMVALVTGSVHVQGEELQPDIAITYINKWKEEHGLKKVLNYLWALLSIYVLLLTKFRKYEVFFISVPPMGYLLNIICPNRFSMLVWDVYPDTLKITGMKATHFVYRIWSYLNRYSFKKAFKLFTIGEKMADLLNQYVDRNKLIIQPIWSIFQENTKIDKKMNPFVKQHNLEDKFVVQYSGNIGLTHKVEVMIALAEQFSGNDKVLFQIIGRGPRKKYLQQLVESKDLQNCQFLPFQSDELFPYSLSAADIGIVILDEKTSKGSVPSKSYNLMSYGIPSLYIAAADSELKHYTDIYNHAKCFSEEELDKAAAYILNLLHDSEYYKTLVEKNLIAAQNFRRTNAAKLVASYLK